MTYAKSPIEYANPWHTAGFGQYGPKTYKYYGVTIKHTTPCGRGQILHVKSSQFDLMINGRVVTQRAGWKNTGKQILADMVAFILDGKTDLQTPIWQLERALEFYNKD